MSDLPLVSIIIPTYNNAHLIGETLDSVLAQTYTHLECIVVDDGSSDNTDEIVGAYVAKDSRFCLIKRPEHKIKGASPCRNHGFDNSKGDYIIFLDSDDWLLSHCLLDRVSIMKKDLSINFSITPMSIKFKGAKATKKEIPYCDDYLKEFLSSRFHWGIMCTIWKRDALKEIGGFNENYPRLNDPEIHIRAMLKFENSYLVRFNAMEDTVYRVDGWKTGKEFSLKHFQSLNLFFNDIVNELNSEQKQSYIPYLKLYLNGYFKNSYWITLKANFNLLKFARKKGIINTTVYLISILLFTVKLITFKFYNLVNFLLNKVAHRILKVD